MLSHQTGAGRSLRPLGVRVDDIAPSRLLKKFLAIATFERKESSCGQVRKQSCFWRPYSGSKLRLCPAQIVFQQPSRALIDAVADAIARRTRLDVLYANAHLIIVAQSRHRLTTMFDRAGIVFCDGAGVQLATWLRTGHRPARHTPPQWILPLSRRLAASVATVYWLGGTHQAVDAAAMQMDAATGLRCVGRHFGYFDMTLGSAENVALLADIERAAPDLLLINLVMPLQERWLFDHRERLQVPVTITGGALFDHLPGLVCRPPVWVATIGLEWLIRLLIEPRRLWCRYAIGLPFFSSRLRQKLSAQCRASSVPWSSQARPSA